MSDPNPLARFTAPVGSGAAFRASGEGGLALVLPLTPKAEMWLRGSAAAEATWLGDALVVEMRFFPALADAIIAAGFFFERDALPN